MELLWPMDSLQEAIKRATDDETFSDSELELAFKKRTRRELEVATPVVDGKSSREIGVALDVSVNGNVEKFRQNPAMREFLLSTGNTILVEAAPRDQIWGIVRRGHSPLFAVRRRVRQGQASHPE
jgi:FixJ family two-component response regulator